MKKQMTGERGGGIVNRELKNKAVHVRQLFKLNVCFPHEKLDDHAERKHGLPRAPTLLDSGDFID